MTEIDRSSMVLVERVSAGFGLGADWFLAPHKPPGGGHHPINVRGKSQNQAVLERATVDARMALEEAAFAAAVAAQRALSYVEVLDEALAILAQETPAPAARTKDCFRQNAGMLSRREREVLALVAKGRSNKAIAEALFVSPNTVKTHVASLLNKLHAESRVQLAVMAARQEVHGHGSGTV